MRRKPDTDMIKVIGGSVHCRKRGIHVGVIMVCEDALGCHGVEAERKAGRNRQVVGSKVGW